MHRVELTEKITLLARNAPTPEIKQSYEVLRQVLTFVPLSKHGLVQRAREQREYILAPILTAFCRDVPLLPDHEKCAECDKWVKEDDAEAITIDNDNGDIGYVCCDCLAGWSF